MKSTRRLYINNWAILSDEKQIRWFFGDISGDRLNKTMNFIRALSKLGSDILGQVIGIVRLRYPLPHPTRAREIMIVNLMEKYNIVISDPLVTTRMMNRIQLDSDPVPHMDDFRSILAGAASVIYSDFYTQREVTLDEKVVDSLFQEAVSAVTFNTNVTVGNGECSFSALSIEELLFFHVLLKNLFESYGSSTVHSKPWGIISSDAGAPIHLTVGKPPADPALLSSLSSVIIDYCKFIFDATPYRLIFGIHPMHIMDFIVTDHHFFVLNEPHLLLKNSEFIQKWKNLPREVTYNLAPEMKKCFAELLGQEYGERVKKMKFHQVINSLTKMGIKKAREYVLPTIKLPKKEL